MRETRRRALIDPSKRTLVLLGVIIVLLIGSLLGMHSLHDGSSDEPVDDSGGGFATSLPFPDAPPAEGQPGSPAHCVHGCAESAPGPAPDMPVHVSIAVCTIMLLARLILSLARPAPALPMAWQPRLSVPTVLPGILRARPTPDLTVLSISRI